MNKVQYLEDDRYRWMFADVFIGNGRVKRLDKQSFMMFWKNRRNAGIALKKRLREGRTAKCLLDTKTMDIVTDMAIIKEMSNPVQIVPSENSTKRKRKPKGLRYAK